MKVILVDIEGTITDINFVKNVLFPYASQYLASYVTSQMAQKNEQVEQILQDTFDLWKDENQADHTPLGSSDLPSKESKSVQALIEILLQWIREDKKATPLETIATPPETIAKPVETIAKPLETIARRLETIAKPFEKIAKPPETLANQRWSQ